MTQMTVKFKILGLSLLLAAGYYSYTVYIPPDMIKNTISQLQTKESDEKVRKLNIDVLVDNYFIEWLDTLENKGTYLSQKWTEFKGFEYENDKERRINYTDKDIPKIINDQFKAASKIFENSQKLTNELGEKLVLNVNSINIWNYNSDNYKIGNNYDAKKILDEVVQKNVKNNNILIAFTGLELNYERRGINSKVGGLTSKNMNSSVVGTSLFNDNYQKGVILAHEIGHCLGAPGFDKSKDPKYLMSQDKWNVKRTIHPDNAIIMGDNIKKRTNTLFDFF